MARVLSVFLLVIAVAYQSHSETWITYKGKVQRLKKSTNCVALSLGNQNVACDCCLIKNTAILKDEYAAAADNCNESLSCPFDKNDDSKKVLSMARENLHAMTIINVNKIPNAPTFPDDGILLESHILEILRIFQKEGMVALPNNIDNTLSIKPLGDSAKGYYSGQLFAIRFKDDQGQNGEQVLRPLFILKETKKGVREINHLYRVSASSLAQEKTSTALMIKDPKAAESAGIARMAFDDLHFKLESKGKTRYFSLLQTAPGQSLRNYLRDFGKAASRYDIDHPDFIEQYQQIKHIFYRIGFSISLLHQKYAVDDGHKKWAERNTYVHGDMHSENIFIDTKTDTITLIDNETFALSLKRPSSGVNDILEFYMMHTIRTVAQKFSDQLTTNTEFGIDDRIWHELCRTLFDGYLSAYGDISADDYLALYKGFRKEFFHGFSHKSFFESIHNVKDQRKLKRLGVTSRRRNIERLLLRPTFNRLFNEGYDRYDEQPDESIN